MTFDSIPEDVGIKETPQESEKLSYYEKVLLLYSAWSAILQGSDDGDDLLLSKVGLKRSSVPPAPHLEKCKLSAQINQCFDRHEENESFPPWTIWKGFLGLELLWSASAKGKEQIHFGNIEKFEGAYPLWVFKRSHTDMEQFVWSNHKPWIPRPLTSMHVRMGDKASEMKEVIDKTRFYPHWNFYYTNVTHQVGNMTMVSYEGSLGRETSTNYPLVNFIMAAEADFYIGTLGSTWCFLTDGMWNTGEKVTAGYLSVNKDRFW